MGRNCAHYNGREGGRKREEGRVFVRVIELYRAAPTPISIILLLLLATIVAGLLGWFYSPHTRRLVRFTLLFLGILTFLIGLAVFVLVKWFPAPVV